MQSQDTEALSRAKAAAPGHLPSPVRADAVLDLVWPGAPGQLAARAGRSGLRLQVAAPSQDKDTHHDLRVEVAPRRILQALYTYHDFDYISRARIIQSCAYMQFLLTRLRNTSLQRRGFVFMVDTCDLATRPGSIGFNRIIDDRSVTLIPDVYFYLEKGYASTRCTPPRWEDRRASFFWRGSTTGGSDLDRTSIADLPRLRMCLQLRHRGAEVDAGFTAVVQARSPGDSADLRALLEAEDVWREPVSWEHFYGFRFLLDIDGNAGSWSFLKKLLTGSCVVKVVSQYEQWFERDAIPWRHYVPVRRDLSDLQEVVSWCMGNDAACRAIGQAGRAFALERDFESQMSLAAAAVASIATPLP